MAKYGKFIKEEPKPLTQMEMDAAKLSEDLKKQLMEAQQDKTKAFPGEVYLIKGLQELSPALRAHLKSLPAFLSCHPVAVFTADFENKEQWVTVCTVTSQQIVEYLRNYFRLPILPHTNAGLQWPADNTHDVQLNLLNSIRKDGTTVLKNFSFLRWDNVVRFKRSLLKWLPGADGKNVMKFDAASMATWVSLMKTNKIVHRSLTNNDPMWQIRIGKNHAKAKADASAKAAAAAAAATAAAT